MIVENHPQHQSRSLKASLKSMGFSVAYFLSSGNGGVDDMVSKNIGPDEFSVKFYRRYEELPFALIDALPVSVYIVDYKWTYLFINQTSRSFFGPLADELIGKSALDVFKDPKFKTVFDKILAGVQNKIAVNVTIYSPLRGRQMLIKGHPLEDCYYFSSTLMPSKEEIIEELRSVLKKKRDKKIKS